MIIRVLQAKVMPGKQAEFKRIVELLSLPHIGSRKGLIAHYPGQMSGANSNEFVLVTLWKDIKTLKHWSREEWIKAIVPEEALPLLEELRLIGYEGFGNSEYRQKPLFNYMDFQMES